MKRTGQAGRHVNFTHLEKPYFPQARFTKGDMVKYYIDVAPYLLPHLAGRPVTLIRYPEGVEGESFYEKNVPKFAPGWIGTTSVARRHSEGSIRYIVIDDASALAWCANLGAIEFHPFLHRAKQPDQPTCVAFDLDPGDGADLVSCIRVAFLVKKITDRLGLQIFPKVSGSKGLQLFLPLNTATTYPAAQGFAKAVAEMLSRQKPDLVVSNMSRSKREGRVLIDWSQNSPSKTTVAVYSMRGKRSHPYVSMPVSWEELAHVLRVRRPALLDFSPGAALGRLRKSGERFAPVLTLKQKLPRGFAGLDPAPAPALAEYEARRDFKKTAEPGAEVAKGAGGAGAGRFVIQKHAATNLHYDFRLEMDGTLKSWAVPKGLSTEPGVKRAAFEVEDHPVAYLRFEGTIPKGQYGGGTVMVWDIGTYRLLGGSHAGGDLKLRLSGRKLKGEWHLFRIKNDERKPTWLVVKSGKAAPPVSARREDMSVLTRCSMARIARDNDASWRSGRQHAVRRPSGSSSTGSSSGRDPRRT